MTSRTLLAPARLAGRSVLGSQSDERLADLASSGSTPAYEAIVSRYRGPLHGYCVRILGEERAEDAVQQTFIKAHAALARGEAVLKLRPWLYRIAHNTALNALRDSRQAHEALEDRIEGGETPDLTAERQQSLRDAIAAVQALPPRQRDAIVLRALEGRSYEEIARELSVTSGAVRQLLARARRSLRAGATALTPAGPLLRLATPLSDAPDGALAAKACVTALVAGAVAGGVTTLPADHRSPTKPDRPESAGVSPKPAAGPAAASASTPAARPVTTALASATATAPSQAATRVTIAPAPIRSRRPADTPTEAPRARPEDRHPQPPRDGLAPEQALPPQGQPGWPSHPQGDSHEAQASVSFSPSPCPEGTSASEAEHTKEEA